MCRVQGTSYEDAIVGFRPLPMRMGVAECRSGSGEGSRETYRDPTLNQEGCLRINADSGPLNQFLKRENRALVLARDQPADLLQALEEWHPVHVEKMGSVGTRHRIAGQAWSLHGGVGCTHAGRAVHPTGRLCQGAAEHFVGRLRQLKLQRPVHQGLRRRRLRQVNMSARGLGGCPRHPGRGVPQFPQPGINLTDIGQGCTLTPTRGAGVSTPLRPPGPRKSASGCRSLSGGE
jgi:hypothetical protein